MEGKSGKILGLDGTLDVFLMRTSIADLNLRHLWPSTWVPISHLLFDLLRRHSRRRARGRGRRWPRAQGLNTDLNGSY